MKHPFSKITVILVTLAMLLTMISTAFAADETTGGTVVITKYAGNNIGNTDALTGTTADKPTGTQTVVSGVTFEMYDTGILKADYAGIGTGKNQVPDISTYALGTDENYTIPTGYTKVDTQVTSETGVATLTAAANNIYLVVEKSGTTGISTISKPFYVSFPWTYMITAIDGTQSESTPTNVVYAYPKNVTTHTKTEIMKQTSGNQEGTANAKAEIIGSDTAVNWESQVTVKATGILKNLKIDDVQDEYLGSPSSIVLKVGTTSLEVTTDYTQTITGNDFSIVFTDAGITKLKRLASNDEVVIDVTYNSNTTAALTDKMVSTNKMVTSSISGTDTDYSEDDTDVAYVTPGAIKFTKTNSSGTALAGATFTITNKADATKTYTATSSADGIIEVDSLTAGTYTVSETVTPAGFVTVKDFELKIPGTATVSEVDGVVTVASQIVTTETGSVINYTKHELPLTGGTGITLLVIAGTLLIGGAVVLMKKKAAVK